MDTVIISGLHRNLWIFSNHERFVKALRHRTLVSRAFDFGGYGLQGAMNRVLSVYGLMFSFP